MAVNGQLMPESQNTEWKSAWRDEYLKWICGFANAEGGTIQIGVDDDGNVVGLPNAKRLLEDIPNKIVSQLGIVCDVSLRSEGELDYLEIKVDPSPYPVSYRGRFTTAADPRNSSLPAPPLRASSSTAWDFRGRTLPCLTWTKTISGAIRFRYSSAKPLRATV